MAPIVCLLNQKGGVGKTSSCFHLGGTLAKMGMRILLVDNDPQASLTQGFFGPEGMQATPASSSIAAVYDPDLEPIAEALIRPTGIESLRIIAGSPQLTHFNMLPTAEWSRCQGGMREVLSEAAETFDLVLIDCPPNLHLCAWAALAASDLVVIPLQAEDFGAQGLGPVQAAMETVRSTVKPSLGLGGYLITMYDRRLGIHLAYESMLREMYGDDVFAATFPLAKDFKESVASRLPVSHYKPKSTAAKATKAVADELLERLVRLEQNSRRVA